MKAVLRALIVEDSEFDAQMIVSMLRKGGYEVTSERVETEAALRAALDNKRWDVVLAVTRELEQRRLARAASNVTSLDSRRKPKGEGK